MKTPFIKPVLPFYLLFFLQACSVNNGINPNAVSEFSAIIDGNEWKTDDVVAISLLGSFTLTATKGDDTFAMQFREGEMEAGKTYTISATDNSSLFNLVSFASGDESFLVNNGTLTLLKYSAGKSAEAEFSFSLIDLNGKTISVENGRFRAEVLL